MSIVSRISAASRSTAVIVLVALLVGALVAPTAFGAAKDLGEQSDRVAVIEVGSTIAGPTAEPVEAALQEARTNDSIEAVVLAVNTPGGALSATESLALEVERTAEVMPVVTSVSQMAASGGYYVSAPTDHIVANPSALIGSVGINFAYVDAGTPTSAIQSGPDKSGGYTEAEAIEMADMMVEGFYGTVLEHRGEELELSKTDLSYAKVYPSQKALHNGLIDEVGTQDTAIQIAAERADLEDYEVVEMDTTPDFGSIPLLSAGNASSTSPSVQALVDPAPGVPTPVALALYGHLPEEQVIVSTAGPGTTGDGTAVTEVDA
jgi:protease-4